MPNKPIGRQRGSIAVLFALMLFTLVGCLGLALDAAQVYNRQSELQGIADGAAQAAARRLDGTAAGLRAAAESAASVVGANRYGYHNASAAWRDAALSFSSAPDSPAGAWLDLDVASAAPGQLWYARVDTGQLDTAVGQVGTMLLASLASAGSSLFTRRVAVAGRSAINVTPLAVCAMDVAATTQARGGLVEAVQYGFRRGVGYDLLKLSPNTSTAASYLVDPIALPGQESNPADLAPAALNAYMCTGRLAMAALPASLHVQAIPDSGLAFSDQLNARFDLYTGAAPCNARTAPPDQNVQAYLPAMGKSGGGGWWKGVPLGQTAALASARPPLRTVADLALLTGETVGALGYGVLWAYSQPVSASGTAFTTSQWALLYPVNSGAALSVAGAPKSYPGSGSAPYARTADDFFSAPQHFGVTQRRVLNIPLLACPVPASGAATVLAVGRFFMSAPASKDVLSGEFAGLAAPAALGGPVGLFQ